MKTSPASVVNAFNKLATPELRQRAIWALIARFTSDELNGLRAWSHSEVRYRDPICVLPIELLSRIFRLLDLRTAFRCHRVSKDWRQLLSSYEIIRGLFHSWLFCGSQSTLYSRDTPAPIVSRMAAHFDAFRTGDPFAMTTQVRTPRCLVFTTATAAYCGGLLAWSEDLVYTTNLLCLQTGRTKLWTNEARTRAYHIAVSELLVATCNSFGNVSVFNHLTDDEYTLKLSSANVKGFTLRSTTLAILLDREINVWSLTTQRTRQILLVSDSMTSINCISTGQETFGLQFAANGRDLICFHAMMCNALSGKVAFIRVTSDGAPQETSTEHTISTNCPSTYRETCQMIPSEYHTFGTVVCDNEAILIGYDESRNQPVFHALGRSYGSYQPNGYYQRHVLYQTKTIRSIGGSGKFRRRMFVKDLHNHRGQHNTEWKTTNMEAKVDTSITEYVTAGHKVLGDETFLVHMYPTHIVAYCFDQNSEGGYSWTKLRPPPVSHKK